MKKLTLLFVIFFLVSECYSQDFKVKVWPKGAPDSNEITEPEEIFDGPRVRNVTEAEMYVYLPEKSKNTGAAVLICPGGGYMIEAIDYEGYGIAKWFAERGITGIMLKYRLPNGHDQIPSEDARQALRIIRQNAKEWGIDPKKVGIAGSSAGGHLASTAGTRFDYGDPAAAAPEGRQSCRPDFMLLLYPVITFNEEFGHMGSRVNLMGGAHDWQMVKKYSNELQVTPETPPTFLVLADDDKAVPPRNSVEFYMALKKYDIPAEMHIFNKGGHGFGIKDLDLPVKNWPNLFTDWLKAIGII